MRRPEFIARQSRCPSGLLGRLIARIMESETAAADDQLLSLLDLRPDHQVLEIGFGHGRTLGRAAAVVTRGRIAGIDLSEDMLRMATRRLRPLIDAGRVELRRGDSARLPYDDGSFDRVYTLHTLYFWPDPPAQLTEIRRGLKEGGRLVLAFTPGDDPISRASFPDTVYHFRDTAEVARLLAAAGFSNIDRTHGDAARPLIFATAHR